MSSILDFKDIITGMKNIKPENQPTRNSGFFDKTKPIHAHNFPLSKVTEWYAFGYRLVNGKNVYDWITKRLPTGHAFVPDLDHCIEIKHTQIY